MQMRLEELETLADAVLIARFANEDKEAVFTDKGKLNADVMHDGNIDGQDAAKILQYIAKKIGYDEFAAGIDVDRVVAVINARPKISLGDKSPYKVFSLYLT